MFKKFFKVALRNIRRSKMYSAINICGLSISLAVSILLLLWVTDELGYDHFNENARKIYKLAPTFGDGNATSVGNVTSAPIAVFAKREVPEVENACRLEANWGVSYFDYKGKRITEWHNNFVDASFFTMFTYPFVNGDPRHPFTDAYSIVLSETTAKRIFGNEYPIGKALTCDDMKTYHVTGVMKDMPENSSIKFNVAFNFEQLEKEYNSSRGWKSLNSSWGQYDYDSYLMLKPGAKPADVGQKLAAIHRANENDEITRHLGYRLNPLTRIHLYAVDGKEQGMMIVRVFLIVAIFVLCIACINYVNLVTSRAIKRSREISLRKIVGAGKASLFFQFLSESFVMFSISLCLATGLIYLVMPLYNQISDKNIAFRPWSPEVLWVYGLTFVATILLAGIYPAVTLASLKPLEAMKGKLSRLGTKARLRKVLVVAQFCFSIMLIVSTIVIGKQLKYIREKNLGYDKANVFDFWTRNIEMHYDAAKAELLRQPGITGVTEAGVNILDAQSGTTDVSWDGKRQDQGTFAITQLPIKRNFITVMGIRLKEGSGFSGTPADSANFILNETAIRESGISEPVIGKRFTLHSVKGIIAGVAEDFHFQSMRAPIGPLVIQYGTNLAGKIYIKTTSGDASKAIAAAEKVWKEYNPNYDFLYSFLDSDFNDLYKSDARVGQLFNCFAILAIFISCLGLFGLVTFTAESRVKEIGLRKALGASVYQIVAMLSKEFLMLVILASAIASPIAWYALTGFLQGYAYRTTMGWEVFVLAAAITIVIAMVTVGFKCVNAALANPIKSLRID